MGNLLDYMDWRGDLSFRQDPFNEIDNLILSYLSYIDFEDFEGEISVEEALRQTLLAGPRQEHIDKYWFHPQVFTVYEKAATLPRFSGIKLAAFQKRTNFREDIQFAAVTYRIGAEIFIAFRGTDETLAGWAEDFHMSYRSDIQSQVLAADYVKEVAEKYPGPIRIGGHSKGGNLAFYAAMKQNPQVQERIQEIYNNDGPGFLDEIIQSEEYQRILPKATTYLPESSVVGMLLGHHENYVVIQNESGRLTQHNPVTWEILGNSFLTKEHLSKDSRIFKGAMDAWLRGLEIEKREKFVQTLFEIISKDRKTLSELMEGGWSSVTSMADSYGDLDAESKGMLKETLKKLLEEIVNRKKNSIKLGWKKREKSAIVKEA